MCEERCIVAITSFHQACILTLSDQSVNLKKHGADFEKNISIFRYIIKKVIRKIIFLGIWSRFNFKKFYFILSRFNDSYICCARDGSEIPAEHAHKRSRHAPCCTSQLFQVLQRGQNS